MYAIRQAYPNAHLTLLTSPGRRGLPGAAELLQGAEWLDELFVYYLDDIATLRQRLKLVRGLRERACDVWIELPQDLAPFGTALRNMVAARLAGAGWGYGWGISTIRWAAKAQSEFLAFPNEVERLLAVVSDSGIPSREPVFPLPLSDRHRRAIDDLLSRNGLTGRPLVAIAPGAKRSTNRWPLDRFAKVGRHLASKGFGVLVMGGASDVEICREVATAVGSSASAIAGQCTLLESTELLKRCRLLICNDSGVQHLAAAVHTPCLSLFSFWQPRGKWRPYGSEHTVVQKWVECHTCLLETCPHDNLCIKLIDADEVIALAERGLFGTESQREVQNADCFRSAASR
jgi:ADP-heptose:LPS heptosyltransferase